MRRSVHPTRFVFINDGPEQGGACTFVDTTGRLDHALAFRFILNIIGRFQIIVIWGKEGDQICSNMDNEPHGFVNDSVDTVNLGSTRDSKIGKQRVLS